MESFSPFRRPSLTLSALILPLLVLVTTVALVAGAPGDSGLPRVGLTAVAILIVVGVCRPVPRAALILAVAFAAGALVVPLASVGQTLGQLRSQGSADLLQPLAGQLAGSLPTALAGGLGLLAIGVAADMLGRACRQVAQARLESSARVESLQPVDATVGVTKFGHARLVFERELLRARRHRQPLAMLRVVVDQWDVVRVRLGSKRAALVLAEVGAHLLATTRTIDLAAYHANALFDIVLPDTPKAGAVVVAQRIVAFQSAYPGVQLRVGVAPLAQEHTSLDDLLQQAQLAVEIAERLDHPYAVCGGEAAPADAGEPELPEQPSEQPELAALS